MDGSPHQLWDMILIRLDLIKLVYIVFMFQCDLHIILDGHGT